MTNDSIRAVVCVPMPQECLRLIETIEPRAEVIHDPSLVPPMRWPTDWIGDSSFRRTEAEQERFEQMLCSADALLGVPGQDPALLGRVVRANPRLRMVMTTAAGGGAQVRAAGLDTADLSRVRFVTAAGIHGTELSEFAVFGVLAGAKNLPRLLADQATSTWPARWAMRQISEMRVLVMGLGGIGRVCAHHLRNLGAEVWGANNSGRPVEEVHRVIRQDELRDELQHVDAVVVTLPGTAATEHLIDERFLAATRPGVIIVNVGRGSVIDERALLSALDDGQVSFAALDVFDTEPLAETSPLWRHDRVLISPHTAGFNQKEEPRMAQRFAENLTRLLDGQELIAPVNTTDFY